MLTQTEVVPYLLRRQLISVESIMAGELVVVNSSRRNRNFMVQSERGPSYMSKHPQDADGIGTSAHEAAIYTQLQSSPVKSKVARYLPHCYPYDTEEQVLVLELVRGAENLREYHARIGRFPAATAAHLGRALGAVHAATMLATEAPDTEAEHGRTANWPWILMLHRPYLGMIRELSSANVQLIQAVQSSGELCARLDELRAQWRPTTLMHGDIKWDNCLVSLSGAAGTKQQVKLVDWELAQPGDPCWDVGAVFADYLSYWLSSMPMIGAEPAELALNDVPYPLGTMQPAMRAFWQTYVRQLGLNTETADGWLLRAVNYAAARLIQTCYEQLQQAMHLSRTVAAYLQLSLNALRRPVEAAVHLLGLPLLSWSPA